MRNNNNFIFVPKEQILPLIQDEIQKEIKKRLPAIKIDKIKWTEKGLEVWMQK